VLKQIGVSISLDDFGTGYSSLNYLKRFPIDKLKIDQSFVRDLTVDPDDAAIAISVITLAHSLRRRVIAEGVETEAQLAVLQRHNCDAIQGYLFSRPPPADRFMELLTSGKRLAASQVAAKVQRLTLLIVDDNPKILSSLGRVLQNKGYRLLTAESAEKGLELLALNEVQVVVSDQRMPGMSGIEFLSRVKALYPDTVRIMLSGHADLESLTEALNRGLLYKYLTKPWNDRELRAQLRDAFRFHATHMAERSGR